MKKFIITICSLILLIITASAVMLAQRLCSECGQPLPKESQGKKVTADNVARWKSDNAVYPSGKTATKEFSYRNFSKITMSRAFKGKVRIGAGYSVRITMPDNMFDYLAISQKDGNLSIGTVSDVNINMDKDTSFDIEITMPLLTEAALSGICSLDVSGRVKGRQFEAELSGMSRLTLSGDLDCDDVDIELSGASTFECDRLLARKCELSATGISRMSCTSLDADNLKMEFGGQSKLAVAERLACDRIKSSVTGMSEVACHTFMAEKGSLNVSGMSAFRAEEGNANGLSIMSDRSSICFGSATDNK